MHPDFARRRFLAFLAASPLYSQPDPNVIKSPADALNVMDFEPAARKVLPPAHYGYLSTGVDDDATLRANRDAYSRLYLRPRRLVDISRPADLSVNLYGVSWPTPIGLAPIGNQKAFHPDAELPVARAARAKNTLQILSTMTNTPLEDVRSALGGQAPWYQLYATNRWSVTEKLMAQVEAAGCPAVALTVDTQAGRHIETFERLKRLDPRPCTACHPTAPGARFRRMAMFRGLDTAGLSSHDPAFNWSHIPKLKALSPRTKLLIKGIETAEDARLCLEHGADGIIVSNHGGRAGESGRGTLDCLPEIIATVRAAAGPAFPVFLDGGIRRGTDIFKALALGAAAVFIGRPYIWALAAFGQPGVERVLDILRLELELVMKQCGVTSIPAITPASIGSHSRP